MAAVNPAVGDTYEPPPPYPGNIEGGDILLQREPKRSVTRPSQPPPRPPLPIDPTTSENEYDDVQLSTSNDEPNQTTVELGLDPVTISCPHCRNATTTKIIYENSSVQWMLCVLIFLVGGVLGCFLIPFSIKVLSDYDHYCTNCNRRIMQIANEAHENRAFH